MAYDYLDVKLAYDAVDRSAGSQDDAALIKKTMDELQRAILKYQESTRKMQIHLFANIVMSHGEEMASELWGHDALEMLMMQSASVLVDDETTVSDIREAYESSVATYQLRESDLAEVRKLQAEANDGKPELKIVH